MERYLCPPRCATKTRTEFPVSDSFWSPLFTWSFRYWERSSEVDFSDEYFEACRAPDTCVWRSGKAPVKDMKGRSNYPGLKWGCRSGVSPATTALGPSYSFTFNREASLYDISLLSLQRAVNESWTAGSGATVAVLTEKNSPSVLMTISTHK